VPESVYVFWVIVAVLALAAAVNHCWHHPRGGYLPTRLDRVAVRHDGHLIRVPSPSSPEDLEDSTVA
jgi:hypothetical protein